MMRRYPLFAVCALPILLGACVAPVKYNWGNYDQSLYRYYKDPALSTEYMAELESIVATASTTQARVAPGIHAEYGYLLMQAGKPDEARAQFEQEKAGWPESAQLMNNMIRMAGARPAKSAADPTSKE
jgi:hypothetical protein